jgi:hypothetical protein
MRLVSGNRAELAIQTMLSEASLNRNSNTERILDREPEITEALSLTNHISERLLPLLRNILGLCIVNIPNKSASSLPRYHAMCVCVCVCVCARARACVCVRIHICFTSFFIHVIQNFR